MLAGITNQDSSFFKITSPDVSESILNEDIISFSYTEEINKMNTGTLQIYDADNYYSKVLRVGAKFDIEFGYANPDISKGALLTQAKNPTQLVGGFSRSGIVGRVANPSGASGSNGVTTFSCNFYGNEYLEIKKHRIHVGITKGALVTQLLTEIGCVNIQVNFTRQTELLNQDTQIMQRETNYRMLLRFAYEWRAIFRISQDGLGNPSGAFISPSNIGSSSLSFLLSGAFGGDSVFLDYKEGVANVLEYSWKNHQGENGSGDNVRLVPGADGKPTFIRYVTSADTVKAYIFKPERITKRLREAGNFSGRFEKMQEWLSVTDFEEIKWAFDPVELETAPQGLGYSMQLKMMGNPLMSAPTKVFFGEGFPVWFTPKSTSLHITNYYARKIRHLIDNSGYKMDLDIIDAFTLTGGSLI